jgi:hypothetical protein
MGEERYVFEVGSALGEQNSGKATIAKAAMKGGLEGVGGEANMILLVLGRLN